MPITVYTGLPGHGKTSLMVEALLAEAKKASRPIYAAGIDGLVPGIAESLTTGEGGTLRRWNQPGVVEDGALIFVDEAWKDFGHLHDASRAPTPAHVLALAEHRHRGIDFVWTTQTPAQIYPFARGMIQDHHHVTRKFGTPLLEVFSWGELNDDVKSPAKREGALKKVRALPKDAWAAYKSASVHTIKARLPWRVILLPVMVLGALAAAWVAYTHIKPSHVAANVAGHEASASGTDAPPSSSGVGQRVAYRTAAEYATAFTPRIPTMPWTAPGYDGRAVAAKPEIMCVASGPGLDGNGQNTPGGCHCITEQGTRYNVTPEQCQFVVTNGVYNPFKEPVPQQSTREANGGTNTTEPRSKATPPDAVQPVAAATPPPADRS